MNSVLQSTRPGPVFQSNSWESSFLSCWDILQGWIMRTQIGIHNAPTPNCRRVVFHGTNRHLHSRIHSRSIHNSQETKANQVSIDRCINKLWWRIYIYMCLYLYTHICVHEKIIFPNNMEHHDAYSQEKQKIYFTVSSNRNSAQY